MFPEVPRPSRCSCATRTASEKCVACGLCSVACPADAIYLEAGRERRHGAWPARATRRSTRFTRRAASSAATAKKPARVGAIFMGKDYELAVYSKDDFVWDKADLLVPAANTTQTGQAGRAG